MGQLESRSTPGKNRANPGRVPCADNRPKQQFQPGLLACFLRLTVLEIV